LSREGETVDPGHPTIRQFGAARSVGASTIFLDFGYMVYMSIEIVDKNSFEILDSAVNRSAEPMQDHLRPAPES
jgi:hypothetical protein